MADYERRLDRLEDALTPKREWGLARILRRLDCEQRGDPLPEDLCGDPCGLLVEALANIRRERQ